MINKYNYLPNEWTAQQRGAELILNRQHSTMASSLSLDFETTKPQSGKPDATTDRIARDIRNNIDAQFKDEIRTFMENKYSGSLRRENPTKIKVIRVVNTYTNQQIHQPQ